MNRLPEIAGLAGIFVTLLALSTGLASTEPGVEDALQKQLDGVIASVIGAGLRRRDDVVIEINGRNVAVGFSQADCDGLMLVAPLPHTAQGWAHVAPRLDLKEYRVWYLYDGAVHSRVPRVQRLVDRLVAQLRPNSVPTLPRLMAVAEVGSCNLSKNAGPALLAFSDRGSNTASTSGRRWSAQGDLI